MEHGVIDRFEGELAVIEIAGTTCDFRRSDLPSEAKPGDAVVVENGIVRLDERGTQERKNDIDRLMDELFE
ncbi:DUF3006 domain-containing protein [Cohnella suwonensis]|uniref:DUF3006 domain-containing protein n=1 Tax=Cohnella suwonensis TaxID=696072 RepID=A0ABW0LN61_9BACL